MAERAEPRCLFLSQYQRIRFPQCGWRSRACTIGSTKKRAFYAGSIYRNPSRAFRKGLVKPRGTRAPARGALPCSEPSPRNWVPYIHRLLARPPGGVSAGRGCGLVLTVCREPNRPQATPQAHRQPEPWVEASSPRGLPTRLPTTPPVIREIQAAGTTSLSGIATALTERGMPTPNGRGAWQAVQVGRVLARVGSEDSGLTPRAGKALVQLTAF